MTPEIKKNIYSYIKGLLPDDFKNNLFWANERKNEPTKPYVMLIDTVPEQKTHRTAEQELSGNINEVTVYKQTVITVAVFVKGVLTDKLNNLNKLNNTARETARDIKDAFETIDSAYDMDALGLSCEVKSDIRNLTVPVDGGFNYRYEFDLAFGFNEVKQIKKLVGQDVNLNIKEKN